MAEKWADKRAQVANPHGDSEDELGFSDEECDGDLKKNPTAKEIVRVTFSKCKDCLCYRNFSHLWIVYVCARDIPGSFYNGVSQRTQRTSNGGPQRIRIFNQKQISVENMIFWRFIQFHFCVLLLICHVKSAVEQEFKHNLVLDNYFVRWKKLFRLFA